MRIVVSRRERTTLPGDFEALPGRDPSRDVVCSGIRRHPTSSAFAVSPLFGENCVAAVWDERTGELLWVPERTSDIGWSADGESVYALVPKFGPGPRGGIGHRLLRHTWPERELVETFPFSVPSGGADALVVSPSGRRAAVIAIEGPEWYYVLLGLVPSLSQTNVDHRIDDYLLDGPVFSPDERFLVTVGSPRFVWWSWPEEEFDEDEWLRPSEGGRFECGWLHVHDLVTDQRTKHSLEVELPTGWTPTPRPSEPDGWSWTVLWGPEFTGNRTFRIWLPGGMPLDLELPLPEPIEIDELPSTWQGPNDLVESEPDE